MWPKMKFNVKVPEVKNCCFFLPLRYGIILYAYVNVGIAVLAAVFLLTVTRTQQLLEEDSLDTVTSTILFGIFGMNIILNVLLVFAGYKKDIAMLRLYNCYAIATAVAAIIPVIILLSRQQFIEVSPSIFAILLQGYVIVAVRSEIIKLEKEAMLTDLPTFRIHEESIDVPDTETLL